LVQDDEVKNSALTPTEDAAEAGEIEGLSIRKEITVSFEESRTAPNLTVMESVPATASQRAEPEVEQLAAAGHWNMGPAPMLDKQKVPDGVGESPNPTFMPQIRATLTRIKQTLRLCLLNGVLYLIFARLLLVEEKQQDEIV
jgi:hypothetical protein